jgi:sortase A
MRPLTIVAAMLVAAGGIQAARAAWMPAKAVAAQVLLDRAFEESRQTHRPVRPWGWADMAPVARLTVPRLGLSVIVLDKGSGQAMAFGPTLLPGTAGIGAKGTSVIAAHRDTHFRGLSGIRKGDLVRVEGIDGRVTDYRVTGSEVRRWDRFAVRGGSSGARLALATCYPFDTDRHGPERFIVHADAVRHR